MLKPFLRAFWLVVLTTAGALAASHKMEVYDRALGDALLARGGRLLADYGSFELIETTSNSASLAATGRAQVADGCDLIRLNVGALNTRSAQLQALRKSAASFAGKRLHLVHFVGPIKPEWLEALKSSGVQIVNYIPDNAYLVYGTAPAIGRMQAWAKTAPNVQWEGAFQDDYKIQPLARALAAGRASAIGGADLYDVQLVADTNANPATLALIHRLAAQPVRRQFRTRQFLNLTVRLPAGSMAQLAAQPDVVSIQPALEPRLLDERQDQIVAGNLASGIPTGPGYLSWLADKGFNQAQFDASGFSVDVSDSGLDNGTTSPGHFGLYPLGDPAQPSRVAYVRLEGTPNEGSSLEGCDGHGTINTHIVGGYCARTGFPFADASGYDYGLGVCPFVRVGCSVVFDPNFFTYPSYENLQSDAYASGARVSANSWGVTPWDGSYTIDAQAYDALVRDAQPTNSTWPTPGNQEMVIVFAAGNDGPNLQTISTPGCAKNVITVGASENVRSLSTANGGFDAAGDSGCTGDSDLNADNADDLADFSSRGPCADGRMKPDLTAPGTHVTGGVAQDGLPSTNGTGTAVACFAASEVCALPGQGSVGSLYNFFPLGQQFYTVSSGTSHSTPAVAGACALLRQYFINLGQNPPSPAMTKAWLMNSARYLPGAGAGDSLWSPNQGMGELNLGTAFDGVPRFFRDQLPEDKFTATGQTNLYTVRIQDSGKPIRVTLAWTDAPGNTSGAAYNNDLDLTVIADGVTYKGNVFNGAYSTNGGSYDRMNNVESIFLPPGTARNIIIMVTAANINSDGVPDEAPALDQDYALAAYNALLTPEPILALDGTTLTAESCSPPNGAVDPGETVTMDFTLKNFGTAAATNLVVSLLTSNGVVYPTDPVAFGSLQPGGASVTGSFSFVAVGSCGGTIAPVLQLQDGSTDLGTVSEPFELGGLSLNNRFVTNGSAVLIPASGTSGPSSPYPSTISVSGLSGNVDKIRVGLVGLTHTYPSDIDVLLVGPNGASVVLMSYCGGGFPVTNVNLVLDDDAPDALPQWSPLADGSYMPTDYYGIYEGFYTPAPSGPYGHALSDFAGIDPNGPWSLYIQDHADQDSGTLSQGWWLSIGLSNSVCCQSLTSTSPPPPTIRNLWLSNGVATLLWSTIPGKSYCVQYATDLNSTDWTDLVPAITATNSTAVLYDLVDPATQRFYRIRVLP